MNDFTPSPTPNVVVRNPRVRKVANVVLGTAGVLLGVVVTVDAASPAFDLSAVTVPALAGYAYLAGTFGLTVTTPNVPNY